MRDLWFSVSRVPSDHVALQKAESRPWTNGLPCCGKRSRKTTTGSTRFWPAWNNRNEEKNDEQIDAYDRRRHIRGSDQALRRASRGGVPRPHGSEIAPAVVARS